MRFVELADGLIVNLEQLAAVTFADGEEPILRLHLSGIPAPFELIGDAAQKVWVRLGGGEKIEDAEEGPATPLNRKELPR